MKKLIWVPVVVLQILFLGCGPQVTFDEPQPADTKRLSNFPGKIQGDYITGDMQSVLTISDSLIVRTYDYNLQCHKDSLPEGFDLKGDTLSVRYFDDTTVEKQKVNFICDSVFLSHQHFSDTLFRLSDSGVVKKFKGYYFLNDKVQIDSNRFGWEVRKLGITKGILTISFIDNNKDIEKLKAITETQSDTTSYNFKPTPKQFKEFIEEEGFEKTDTFYRMKH